MHIIYYLQRNTIFRRIYMQLMKLNAKLLRFIYDDKIILLFESQTKNCNIILVHRYR